MPSHLKKLTSHISRSNALYDGYDSNFWDEHEPDYAYDGDDEVNPRDVLKSFWEGEWFQFLRNP